jgi:hypothetical protein
MHTLTLCGAPMPCAARGAMLYGANTTGSTQHPNDIGGINVLPLDDADFNTKASLLGVGRSVTFPGVTVTVQSLRSGNDVVLVTQRPPHTGASGTPLGIVSAVCPRHSANTPAGNISHWRLLSVRKWQ